MLFFEHIAIAIIISIVISIVFSIFVVAAQLFDVDHIFSNACGRGFVDTAKLAYKCSGAKNNAEFTDDCMCLHRTFMHDLRVFGIYILFVVATNGLLVGWFVHLIADEIIKF